jgi:aryl-alcohol dehydrogenase-like predicted oxidoreductase
MKIKRCGSQGPDLTVIGYGAWEAGGTSWGPNDSDDAVIDAMRAALDAGINWIDTAEVYGNGVSERLVGKAVAGRRQEVIVASKAAPGPEGSGFRPEQIRGACDASLSRLGIEVIDLYQLHWPDDDIPVEEAWGTMAELQDEGKVRWIGVSNFDREQIERCLAVRHVDSLQQEFSMVTLSDRDLIAWCGESGVGVVSYSPLGAGLLTGAIGRDITFDAEDWRASEGQELFGPENLPRNLDLVEALRPIAEGLGVSLAQLALAWNVAQPGVTAAIAGSRNPDHVRTNAQAGDITLGAETLETIEGLLPKPRPVDA